MNKKNCYRMLICFLPVLLYSSFSCIWKKSSKFTETSETKTAELTGTGKSPLSLLVIEEASHVDPYWNDRKKEFYEKISNLSIFEAPEKLLIPNDFDFKTKKIIDLPKFNDFAQNQKKKHIIFLTDSISEAWGEGLMDYQLGLINATVPTSLVSLLPQNEIEYTRLKFLVLQSTTLQEPQMVFEFERLEPNNSLAEFILQSTNFFDAEHSDIEREFKIKQFKKDLIFEDQTNINDLIIADHHIDQAYFYIPLLSFETIDRYSQYIEENLTDTKQKASSSPITLRFVLQKLSSSENAFPTGYSRKPRDTSNIKAQDMVNRLDSITGLRDCASLLAVAANPSDELKPESAQKVIEAFCPKLEKNLVIPRLILLKALDNASGQLSFLRTGSTTPSQFRTILENQVTRDLKIKITQHLN